MSQAQGSEGILIIMPADTFKTTPVTVIEDCEDAWNESVDADVTATADASVYKVGTKSCKLAVAAGASAGDILATEAIAPAKDLSTFSKIGMWIRSDVALAAGDLQLLMDDTANCASPIETLDVPAVVTADLNTFKFVKMSLAAPASCTAIASIGLKMAVDKGAFNVYLDGIVAMNADAQIIPFKSESLRLSRNLNSSQVIRNTRNPNKPSRGNTSVAGDISTELSPYMTTLFKHLLGSVTTTGASPYTHVFKVGSLPVGLSIEKQFTDIAQYILYDGCRVGSFKTTVNAEGIIECSFGFMGAKENTATTVTGLDGNPTDHGHNPFDAFEATIEEGGSSIATVSMFDLNFEQNLDGNNYVIGGGGERRSLPAGIVKVSGNIKALFETMALYTKAINHTETSLKVTLTKGDGLGSAGNESLEIHLEELLYAPNAPVISGPQGVLVELPFEAYYDNGSNASALQITIKNTQSSVI